MQDKALSFDGLIRRPGHVAPVLMVMVATGVGPVRAQDEAPLRAAVSGTVLDARTGHPLPGATVTLHPAPDGSLIIGGRRSAFWAAGAAVDTDYAGRYRLDGVPVGRYRIAVHRLGYKPAEVVVDLRQPGPFRVSVGLVVVPIKLEPEEITAPVGLYSRRSYGRADDERRLALETFRQREFVPSDVRLLTHDMVIEAVTLGETDLFRALQRLPGVSTRDDFTAEAWTRGAPWSHTRVYFDDLPLFNPLHTFGAFSGINPDAVGSALFQPGVRSASIGEGASGAVTLTSRSATGPGVAGLVELSAVSARAGLDDRFADGRGGIAVAVRRSHIDVLSSLAASVLGDSTLEIPYAFYDMAARAELPIGPEQLIEASGMWEFDEVRGDIEGILRGSQGRWGNQVARVSFVTPVFGLATRHTVGLSRFRGSIHPSFEDFSSADDPVHSRIDNRLDYVLLRGELGSGTSAGGRWTAGYSYVTQRQFYDGPHPSPYPWPVALDSLQMTARHRSFNLWAERRWDVGPGITLETGARLSVGDPVPNAPPLTLAPRLSARWVSPSGIAVTAGYGRSYQYTQSVARAGPGVGPQLHLTDVWLLAQDSAPAIRADVVTLGLEGWLGDGWLAQLNLYGRRAHGVAVPDPEPGVFTDARRVFVQATNRAAGIELGIRRVLGRWTGSIGYTLAASTIEAGSRRYAAPTDRPHVLDATMVWRISEPLRVGAALTLASGAPFTRFFVGVAPCDSTTAVPTCPSPTVVHLTIEQPSGARTGSYTTLDVMAEWRRSYGSWTLGAFVQLRNALFRRNAVTYAGSLDGCSTPPRGARVPRAGVCDLFDRGLPALPLAGVQLAF